MSESKYLKYTVHSAGSFDVEPTCWIQVTGFSSAGESQWYAQAFHNYGHVLFGQIDVDDEMIKQLP